MPIDKKGLHNIMYVVCQVKYNTIYGSRKQCYY